MMRPRLECCYFRAETDAQGEMYERLARVLDFTARRHCPGWDVTVERLDESALPELRPVSGNAAHAWNTWKLDWWRDRVLGAPDGARVLLIDGDTFVTRPLDAIWEQPFDVAYTLRERELHARRVPGLKHRTIPFNAGVVFLRVNHRTRRFMRKWSEINGRFLYDATEHYYWRSEKRYAGINQAALGCLLETVEHGCELRELRCVEWNLVEWALYDPSVTRIVHVKSSLRRAAFALPGAVRKGELLTLSKMWERLERKSNAATAAALEG